MVNSQILRDTVLAAYLIDCSSLIILRLDVQGTVREASSYARSVLGENVTGMFFTDLLVDFRKTFDLAQFRSELAPRLLSFLTPGGMPQTFRVSYLPCGKDGFMVGEHNAEEFEQVQSSMLKLNQEMANISRELQQANAEYRRINEQKNQFLGMAAHELRNPIGSIISYMALLLEDGDGLSPDVVNILKDVSSLADFMLYLVNSLLDYSIIEQGRLVIEYNWTDFGLLAAHTVAVNRLMAQRKGIRLECTPVDVGQVYCDIHKVKQVINNFLSNAIKFSPRNSVITLRLVYDPAHVRLEVADQGPGIPQGEQERLFKPFGRTSVKASEGEESTGLGLAISRRIVESHGGTIGVESELGQGSLFWFELPRRKADV